MNSTSWLIYLANTSENLGTVLGMGAAALFIATCGLTVGKIGMMAEGKKLPSGVNRFWLASIIALPVLSATAALLPSRDTVMMIAVSEIGASVLSTDKAQEIGGEAGELATDSLKLLRKYVTEQLGEEAE